MACLTMSISATAQQKPVFSQYLYSGLVLNPAYAARYEYSIFTAMYRDQWINVPGSPKTITFTGQTGFKDRKLGLGVVVSNDQIGAHNNTMVYFSYGYHIPLSNGAKLSMGIQGGLDFLKSDWTQLSLPDYSQHDPLFQGIETNVFPNFGTGLYLFHDKYFVGMSAPYLLTNTKLNNENLYEDIRHSRKYFITGGLLIHASSKLVFKPSFLLRMEEHMPLAVDLNANIFYNEIVELGVSYRQQDSVIGLIGIQMNQYLKFSYSYDWVISDLRPYTKGSHELALQYRINFNAPRKHRMCPGPLFF